MTEEAVNDEIQTVILSLLILSNMLVSDTQLTLKETKPKVETISRRVQQPSLSEINEESKLEVNAITHSDIIKEALTTSDLLSVPGFTWILFHWTLHVNSRKNGFYFRFRFFMV